MKSVLWQILVLAVLASSVDSLTSDGLALLVFRKELKDPFGVLQNWSRTDEHPCHWTGVKCSTKSNRVEILNLPRKHLAGTISPKIGELSSLRRLGLHENNFYGTMPANLGNLTELRALYLRGNALSGRIPPELGMLDKLRVLDVSSNSLMGEIPSSLANLKKLIFLNMSKNGLSGSIPTLGPLSKFSKNSFMENMGLCGHQLNRSCEASASTGKVKSSRITKNLMLSALGIVTASLCLALMCFWGFVLYSKFSSKPCSAQLDGFSRQDSSSKLVLFHHDKLPFTSMELAKRIEQLDLKDAIGAGAYGMVYKVAMNTDNESRIFAVKKICSSGFTVSSQRHFEKQLEFLASLKHPNIVVLRGYCTRPSSALLIYDYLSNGSLDESLHESKETLDWEARLNIALGAAKGLAYLHHESCPPIIHRDIKSNNILLDSQLQPYLSDIGLAKLLAESGSEANTIVAGTFAYLAPEYMETGVATDKSDVYSFGVVLLELLSGRRPNDTAFVSKGFNLVGWAISLIHQRRCLEVFDPNCRGAELESMEALLNIAAMCLGHRPAERPSMSEVVKFMEDAIIGCSSCSSPQETEGEESCSPTFISSSSTWK